MKRHETLAPLSREHHATLILAQLLKTGAPEYRGLPTSITDKVVYASDMFKGSLIDHFKKEEAILEEVKSFHPAIASLAEVIIAEHETLTALFLSLDSATEKEAALNRLGIELEMHIRKEERILFPLIQEYCPEEILLKLNALLT